MKLFKILLTAVTFSLFSFSTQAERHKLEADLKGSFEVPLNQSQGEGLLTATYDTDTRKLHYEISFDQQKLSSLPTMAHFHGPAIVGKNAGIQILMTTLKSPIKGTAILTESQSQDLLGGLWYFNIHTTEHPAGEIRGQVNDVAIYGSSVQY